EGAKHDADKHDADKHNACLDCPRYQGIVAPCHKALKAAEIAQDSAIGGANPARRELCRRSVGGNWFPSTAQIISKVVREDSRMPQPQRGPDDEGWKGVDPSSASHSAHKGQEGSSGSESCSELEPGWRAIRALMQIHNDELLAVMLRPSFRP